MVNPRAASDLRRWTGQFNRVVDQVEARCLAVDGPVTPTLQEMREAELRTLWLAVQRIRAALKDIDHG